MLPQVGGLHRRQNSGHPLFSVRVRSRRDSRHLLQTKKRLGALFCLEFIEYGSRGEARQLCCRRSEVSTDDKTAVIRCFPCASAQGATPVTCSRQKSAFQVLPPYTSGGAVQALRRRSLSQQSTTAPDTATKVSPCRQDCPIQSFPLLSERKKRIFTATLSSSGFISAASPLKRSAAAASPRR